LPYRNIRRVVVVVQQSNLNKDFDAIHCALWSTVGITAAEALVTEVTYFRPNGAARPGCLPKKKLRASIGNVVAIPGHRINENIGKGPRTSLRRKAKAPWA
jgi:hypothetical protein